MRLAASTLAQAPSEAASPPKGQLNNPEPFERGVAVSLYQFDACGDPRAGRWFRRALSECFAQCHFTAGARARFAQRTRPEQAKVRRNMQTLIGANSGLPHSLDGMSTTCHQQQTSDSYRQFRARLEKYGIGARSLETILPASCDAADIMP